MPHDTRPIHTEVTMPARTKIDQARVKQLLAQGMRPVDIAKRLGCTKNGLSTAITKMRKDGTL